MVSLYSSLFPRVVGLKLFASHSTGNMGITDEKEERNIFQTLTDLDYRGVLAVHAEKTSLFTTDTSHSLSRPAKSEIESQKQAAISEIRAQVAELSVKVAEKILRKELDSDAKQMETIDRLLDEVAVEDKR